MNLEPAGRRSVRVAPLLFVLFQFAVQATARPEKEAGSGHLLIIGGGLKPDNGEVYRRFLKLAGGRESARIGVIPTASISMLSSKNTIELLHQYGLPAGSADLLEITIENAACSTSDPAMLGRISRCTGLFFTGGDQLRIGRSFLRPDGSDTPALAAVRELLRRGGVVAGTSAGAACMSEQMISSRGSAIDSLDQGVDPSPHHRGISYDRGLRLFHAGLIDQHFSHRGRLARLTRVLLQTGAKRGFGIDEDTAIDVSAADDTFEVLGRGGVTIVDTSRASAAESATGFHAHGVKLNYLERGDRYRPGDWTCMIHPGKSPLKNTEPPHSPDPSSAMGDLSQANAVRRTLTLGLATSPQEQSAGFFFRSRADLGYGYRFLFQKSAETQGYRGRIEGDGEAESEDRYAVLNVTLDIEPVTRSLESPEILKPIDLNDSPEEALIRLLVLRGIMTTNSDREFKPFSPVTRAELAGILVRATGIGWGRARGITFPDVAPEGGLDRNIAAAVGAGLMLSGRHGRFQPDEWIGAADLEQAFATARLQTHRDDGLNVVAATFPGVSVPFAATHRTFLTRKEVAIAIGWFLGLHGKNGT